MFNRRDLLKLFGVGAAVVPVLDGKPREEVKALIVRPPEVELIPAEALNTPLRAFTSRDPVVLKVEIWDGNRVIGFEAKSILMEANVRQDVMDVTTFHPGPRVDRSGRLMMPEAIEWTLTGRIIAPVKTW